MIKKHVKSVTKLIRPAAAVALFLAVVGVLTAPLARFAARAEDAAPERAVLIMAHAGASAIAPENTMAAFAAARETGADGVETDVRMTKDRRLVLRHDDLIGMTSDGQGRVSEMTLQELRAFDYGSWFSPDFAGEGIVTVEELLAAADGLGLSVLNFELKPVKSDGEEMVRLLADAVRQSGLQDRVMISSFDVGLLKAMKACAPEIPVAALTVPNLSAVSLLNVGSMLPADKALSDYTVEDVKGIPWYVTWILRAFGSHGGTDEEMLLSFIEGVAAVAPAGATWSDAEALFQREADLVSFVDSLDFPIDYLDCHYGTVSESLVRAMRERGIGVIVWTPNETGDLKKALACAPDGVVTDEPAKAAALRK